jgi:hypothetical protein
VFNLIEFILDVLPLSLFATMAFDGGTEAKTEDGVTTMIFGSLVLSVK